MRHGDTMDSIISPRKGIPPVNNNPYQRPQRNLEHSKVEFGQPDTDGAHHEGEERRQEGADEKTQPRRISKLRNHDRGSIGPRSIEDRVVKLVDASETQDQVKAHREEAVYQDQSQEIDIEPF